MKHKIIKFIIRLLSGKYGCYQGKHKYIVTTQYYEQNGIEEGYCEICGRDYWRNRLM